jgi:hypothetical protein
MSAIGNTGKKIPQVKKTGTSAGRLAVAGFAASVVGAGAMPTASTNALSTNNPFSALPTGSVVSLPNSQMQQTHTVSTGTPTIAQPSGEMSSAVLATFDQANQSWDKRQNSPTPTPSTIPVVQCDMEKLEKENQRLADENNSYKNGSNPALQNNQCQADKSQCLADLSKFQVNQTIPQNITSELRNKAFEEGRNHQISISNIRSGAELGAALLLSVPSFLSAQCYMSSDDNSKKGLCALAVGATTLGSAITGGAVHAGEQDSKHNGAAAMGFVRSLLVTGGAGVIGAFSGEKLANP